MKHLLRHFASILSIAAIPALHAADGAASAQNPDSKQLRGIVTQETGRSSGTTSTLGPRIERRMLVNQAGGATEKEVVTFLGVETAPVSPTLTAQLGLTDGMGLVVAQVAPDSPAAAVLKEHDILLKLDDQLLIEQRQLSVLVRNHKEGDEVTLTYLRGGKQATAKLKLAKHEVLKQAFPFATSLPGGGFGAAFGPGSGNVDMFFANPGPGAQQARENAERMLPLVGAAKSPGVRIYSETTRPDAAPGESNVSVRVNTANSHLMLDDDKGSVELTIKDGQKNLVAKNVKGEQIFSGPVNTPEERKALPADVRDRLGRLEDSTQFGYRPGGDFKTETRIVRPLGQGISLPQLMRPMVPAREPLFF